MKITSLGMTVILVCFVYSSCCATVFSVGQENKRNRVDQFFDRFDSDRNGDVTKNEIIGPAQTVDVVVGAKGDSLQLVLNSMYYLSNPVENIPYSVYLDMLITQDAKGNSVQGAYAKYVVIAIPILMGDRYGHFRVVGTNSQFLNRLSAKVENDEPIKFSFAEGDNFDDKDFFTAVIGYNIATAKDLSVGDSIQTSHDESNPHEKPFRVVGILDKSNTPHDDAVFVNMEGFYLQEDHALPSKRTDESPLEKLPIELREVTAVLIIAQKGDFGINDMFFSLEINQGNAAQAVKPIAVIQRALQVTTEESMFYSLRAAVNEKANRASKSEFQDKVRSSEAREDN